MRGAQHRCAVELAGRVARDTPNHLSIHRIYHPSIDQAAASAELQRMNAFFTDVDQGSLEVETVPAPP
jgi:hypothetical protein